MATAKKGKGRGKGTALARRPRDPARYEVWVTGDDGSPLESITQPVTRARAEAIAAALGAQAAIRLVGPAPSGDHAIAIAPTEPAMRALRVAARAHEAVRGLHVKGQAANVVTGPLTHALIEHLSASPKVHRVVDSIMDLLGDFSSAASAIERTKK